MTTHEVPLTDPLDLATSLQIGVEIRCRSRGFPGKRHASRGMEAPYSRNLRIWEGWSAPALRDAPFHASFLAGPHSPAAFAERLFAFEALSPRRKAPGKDD